MPVPTTDELQEFIDDALCAKLKANRKIRSANRRRNTLIMALVLIVFLPVTIGVTIWIEDNALTDLLGESSAVSVPVIFALLFAFLYMPIRLRYSSEEIPFEYTPDIVAPLVHFIDPRLTYCKDGGVEAAQVADIGLGPSNIGAFRTRHLFEGTVSKATLQFCHVEIRQHQSRWFQSASTCDFQGLFFDARLAEEFPGTTIIEPRRSRDFDGGLATDLDDDRLESVELEHVGIDLPRRFVIRSTHPERVGDRLSCAIGERIDVLYERFADEHKTQSAPFVIILTDSRLVFAHRCETYFDRDLDRFSLDTTHLRRLGRQLCALVDLAEMVGAGDSGS